MSFLKPPVLILLAVILLGLSVSSFTPDRVEARTLPTHCVDLLDGDCDVPWLCLIACYMELRDQAEYCVLNPTDPRCL